MPKEYSPSWLIDTLVPFIQSIVVVGVFVPWLLVIYTVVASYSGKLDVNDQKVIQGFIEWFGTAYSFFLALALVNVWSQFETVERELDRELDAISTLLQTVEYTRVSSKKHEMKLRGFKNDTYTDVQRYISHVIQYHRLEQHHRLEQQVSLHHRNGDQILEGIGNRIGDLASNKVVAEPFIYELFRSLNEAMDVRGDRISHSKSYTPVIVQLVALVSSAIWLLSFFGLVIYDLLVAITLVGGVTFVIIMVLVIFFDLSEPFGGIWRIKLEDWHEFQDLIDLNPRPQVIFIFSGSSTLKGKIRFLIGLDTCKLNSLANSGLLGLAWNEFIRKVEGKRTNMNRTIKCVSLYSDQLSHYGYSIHITNNDRPLVVLKQGNDFVVLLNSLAIEGCQDLIEFEKLFNRKIKKFIS